MVDKDDVTSGFRALAQRHLEMARRRLGWVWWLEKAKEDHGTQFPTRHPWLCWGPPQEEFDRSSTLAPLLPPPPRTLARCGGTDEWDHACRATLMEARAEAARERYVAAFERELARGCPSLRPGGAWPWEDEWVPSEEEYAEKFTDESGTMSPNADRNEAGYRFVAPLAVPAWPED